MALGDLCTVFADGDWIESKDQSLGGIRLIQTGNVGEGQFKDRGEKARYISEETFFRLRCTEIFEGDCLISRLPDPVGRSCILPDTGERMITAVDCTIVRFNKIRFLPKFFNYYSQSSEYLVAVDSETTGTTRSRISRSKLAQTPIPVPPLPEQQRIVAILDAAFADLAQAKANAQKNLANAKELFASELNTIFTHKGEGWEETTLGNVCDVMTGPFGSLLHKSEYVLSGYPVVNPVDISENYISTEKIKYVDAKIMQRLASYRVHENDILIGRRGDIGRCAVVQKEHEGWLCGTGCFIARPNKETDGNFIASFIRSEVGCEYLNKIATGTTMLNLSNSNLRSLPLNIPKLKEQQRIVTRLDELSEHCKNLEAVYTQKISLYDEMKQSLLYKAFSGDL